MSDQDNQTLYELLQRYRQNGSESALREIISRCLPLVYAAALRTAGAGSLAADVAQTVFCDFASQARALPRDTHPAAWLLRRTWYLSKRAARDERRRRAREEEAARRHQLTQSETMSHGNLESALRRLSSGDHELLLLRYFEEMEVSDIASRLGISPAAAQKRLERAHARLRRRMGAATAGVILTSAIMALLGRGTASAEVPAEVQWQVTGASIKASAHPAAVWQVWLRNLSPAAGALGGAAAAIATVAVVELLLPVPPQKPQAAAAATFLSTSPASAAAARETPAAQTAESIVAELVALLEREGSNRVTWHKAEALVAKVPSHQSGQAAVLLMQHFPNAHYSGYAGGPGRWMQLLIHRWKPDDVSAAMDWLLPQVPEELLEGVALAMFQNFMKQQPDAAITWWQQLLQQRDAMAMNRGVHSAVLRRTSYVALEHIRKENPQQAADCAWRLEDQGIEPMVREHSSMRLRATLQQNGEPATDRPAEWQTSRTALSLNTRDRVALALSLKNERLRDYTLAAMAAQDIDRIENAMAPFILKDPELPAQAAENIRSWLRLNP